MVKRETSVETQSRVGRLQHVGPWGRIALEVPEDNHGRKIVPLRDQTDTERFQIDDVVVFEYDNDGYAIGLRRPTKKDPLPTGWRERS